MDLHKGYRAGLRPLWVVQGLAIAALCAGPGVASADVVHLTARMGGAYRIGNGPQQDSQTQTPTFITEDFISTGDGDSGGGGSSSSSSGFTPPAPGGNDPVSVPEPGTLALLFAGLTGLLLMQWRRRSTERGAAERAR